MDSSPSRKDLGTSLVRISGCGLGQGFGRLHVIWNFAELLRNKNELQEQFSTRKIHLRERLRGTVVKDAKLEFPLIVDDAVSIVINAERVMPKKMILMNAFVLLRYGVW